MPSGNTKFYDPSTNMYDTSTLEGLRAWERSVMARPSLPPDVVIRTVMQRGDYSIVLFRDFTGSPKFSVRFAGQGGTAFGVAGGRGGDARLAWEDAYSWMRKRMREEIGGQRREFEWDRK